MKESTYSQSVRGILRILLKTLLFLSLPVALLMALSAIIIGMFDIIPSYYDIPSTLSLVSSLLLLIYLLGCLRTKSPAVKRKRALTVHATSKMRKTIQTFLFAIMSFTIPCMIISVVLIKSVTPFIICFALFASACAIELFLIFGTSSNEKKM